MGATGCWEFRGTRIKPGLVRRGGMPQIETAAPQLDPKLLLKALRAFRKGDFSSACRSISRASKAKFPKPSTMSSS